MALRHSYHGRSSLAMAMTGQGAWRLGPSAGGHRARAQRLLLPLSLRADLSRLRSEVRAGHGGDDPHHHQRAASPGFIAEPIQGVGGFITPPKEYFPIVEKIVRNHGGIFISDEVQTGWGRTGGKWFGIEQWGVTPDIITSAKGLGNGIAHRAHGGAGRRSPTR